MWWTLVLKIITDPKLLAIIVLSFLLVGASASGYWYKQKAGRLEQRVDELNTTIENMKEINKKITQNRDSLVKQIESLQEIDKKYKSLQVRIDALRKTCARPVKAVVVTSGTPPPVKIEGSKPVEAPGVIVLPGGATTPLPVVPKPEEPKTVSGEVVKTKQPDIEYQFGGYEYETLAKSIYNDLILWFNSADRVQPKSPTTSVSDPNLPISSQTSPKIIGCEQDIGTPG